MGYNIRITLSRLDVIMEYKNQSDLWFETGFASLDEAEQIFALQEKNLRGNIPLQKQKEEWFLYDVFDINSIKQAIKLHYIIVARAGKEIAWFRITNTAITQKLMEQSKDFVKRISSKEPVKALHKPIQKIKICYLHQACVDEKYRGKNIPKVLYQARIEKYGKEFDFDCCSISENNTRSLHVHRDKLWFIPIDEVQKDGEKWIEFLAPTKQNKELFATLQKSEPRNETIQGKSYHNDTEKKFRTKMNNYRQSIKWTDAFGLGKIKRYAPFNWWDIGVVIKFEVEDTNNAHKTYVFKTCITEDGELNKAIVEAEAGRRRTEKWANVRSSIKESTCNIWWVSQPYIILPFIDNSINSEDLKEPEIEDVFHQMGENMALMHRVKGQWFGKIKEIRDWELIGANKRFEFKKNVDDTDIIHFLVENNLFTEDILKKAIDDNCKVINDSFKWGKETTLIHHDMSFTNMFIQPSVNGPKILISDLDATLWHPMEDLWILLLRNMYSDSGEATEEKNKINNIIIDWYKKNWGQIDEKVIHAVMFLAAIYTWVRSYSKWKQEMTTDIIKWEKTIAKAKRRIDLAKKIVGFTVS